MSTPAESREAPTRGGGGFSFTRKIGPMPVWAWMAAILGIAVVYSSYNRNKKKTTQTPGGTAATSTQTAAQTPPFVIQNFPNQPNVPAASTGANPQVPSVPQMVSVGHNQTVQNLVDWARANGYPNFSWSDFWALNRANNIQGLKQLPNGDWQFTGYGTAVTLASPGFTSTGTGAGAISNDKR